MPIFEYRCQICGEKFDKLVRDSTDSSEIRCPKCQSQEVKRLVSLFGMGGAGSFASQESSSCTSFS